ncbi:MAG: LysM peptidoglycan-binding domain-containing protein [Myxococcota bacterium]|nr:LysM peptidoglycan-binding domain-containing protein [Myxococcota bacterium]
MKCRLITTVLLTTVPTSALAQQPVFPPDAPTTLNPGTTGSQGPLPAPAAPQAPAAPNVIVVGPDGKVTTPQAGDQGPTGYYVGGGADPSGFQEPVALHAGPVPELHVVRRGDTLWDLCFFYFNDPWQWPKIWSYNAQITNPHWIYPGDLVRLLPRGVFAQQPGGPPPIGAGPDNQPTDLVPAPAKRTDVSLRNVAFVEKADLDQAIVIDGAVDEKELLTTGDQVYLAYPKNQTPQVGKRYSVYEPGRSVKGYGSYVRVLGTIEVLSVKEDKRARAMITDATFEIQRGAKVGPLVTKFKNVAAVPAKADVQAPIVAMLTHDQLIGQGEVVFLGAGRSSGVQVGNRMFVVRRGDAMPETMSNEIGSDDRRFPARALGEIVVVEVGDKVSVGLVTLSVQEMSIGDLVMMQKAN